MQGTISVISHNFVNKQVNKNIVEPFRNLLSLFVYRVLYYWACLCIEYSTNSLWNLSEIY